MQPDAASKELTHQPTALVYSHRAAVGPAAGPGAANVHAMDFER